ncbi:hypothetical protein G7048_19135 [Diaphorobacter sp. HDW4B]|uniref:hypothetical protein n=1 Tax=Diaphorobacter sp. HDW4B TaxID=2714925 RepID=UPI00140DBB9D|nr:hypothetical protein [Diaphorobacter sp. HDW4B]QIL72281.1 hypothetical protein G7048_19135 [Diaphorobacter sp. HDW4B]
MSETTDIVLLPPKETALQIYSAPQGLDPYLQKIKAELDAFVPDVSTKKGRDAIASIAYKVAKGKTALDNIGKDLVAELKDAPKKIDAERKRMRDLLDLWKDEVRAPLTAWEEAEAARQALHKTGIELIQQAAATHDFSAGTLRATLAAIEARVIDSSWEEFEAEAHRAKAKTVEALQKAIAEREKLEAEQAELARLRAEAAAREQKEHEERIAREAAERARREAEAKAQAEREAVIRREQDAKAAAERRELELRLAAERAEREKAEAIQREQQAKADAERRATEAVEAEKRRVAAQEAADAEAAKRRERDKAHKAAINRAALDAFVTGGMTEECAKLAVTLIAKKSVPAVSITY